MISSRVSAGRVAFFPVGSPIIPVKSPIRNTTRCPICWKCRVLRMTTVWPRWMSGAVGSKPTFTVSGLPRAIFAFRSFFSIRSTEPLARYSSCSSSVMARILAARSAHPLLKHQQAPQHRLASRNRTVVPYVTQRRGIEPSFARDALRIDERARPLAQRTAQPAVDRQSEALLVAIDHLLRQELAQQFAQHPLAARAADLHRQRQRPRQLDQP